MYTLYRSSAAFNECLITILIALLCTTATQKKFLYYPLKLLIFFLYTSKVQNLRRRGWVLAKTNATRGGRVVCSKMNKGEQGGGREGGLSGILSKHTLLICWPVITNDNSIIDPWDWDWFYKNTIWHVLSNCTKRHTTASLQRSSNVFSHCYCWQTTQKRQWLPMRTKN